MDGNCPGLQWPGPVGRTARSRIRPFPLCIIALSRMLLGRFALVLGSSRQKFAHRCQAQPAQRSTLGLIPFFSPSLEDCPDELNSRWRRASAALPERGRACARSRPGGAGSARDCCRRSRTHRRMRPQPVGEGGCPGLGPSSWQSGSISALALRRWGKCACSFASPTSP